MSDFKEHQVLLESVITLKGNYDAHELCSAFAYQSEE
jgi:hypothetical protein